MTSIEAAVWTAMAGLAGVLAMILLMNNGIRTAATARCPGRALREAAAGDAGEEPAGPSPVEFAAILEVAGGVQVIEYVDADPDTAHRLPRLQPVLVPHQKKKKHHQVA